MQEREQVEFHYSSPSYRDNSFLGGGAAFTSSNNGLHSNDG